MHCDVAPPFAITGLEFDAVVPLPHVFIHVSMIENCALVDVHRIKACTCTCT